ncbi:hypothetical protein GUITHDRAFT_100982 [Guillardia theta CCMP2712]|uniref:Uncharacterized protein n=1 Tax=Guillardia theta (strain CCMP2712) TaxID=905079 RepID=L1JY62_GUITC|nr:hypothetical protein GUITHDRAFT_100982 [Guillardia theta CCMP2712]EKX53277.1 hypothetical protein GUITHDRAFT_100982 [Guillardia theta CCMP2712]|eukprot:XP_005840257.1 hypothetical protein GUITHDRAFT_100982 [Guillardia theta CCMP2712]
MMISTLISPSVQPPLVLNPEEAADEKVTSSEQAHESSASASNQQKSKKRALPKASDMLNSTGVPSFVRQPARSSDLATVQERRGDGQEESASSKPKSLLEAFEEKKRKAVVMNSKYIVPPSELETFVEPERKRKPKRPDEGDM